ncbi:MAG: hypothetical protein WC223_13085 [Bacteroidales bacterium]|jgi:hypothetical protein
MKFKITKENYELLGRSFKEQDCAVIELEPIINTAAQAIFENQIRNEAFEKGIEYGYKEGFYEGRCPEKHFRYCKCCR